MFEAKSGDRVDRRQLRTLLGVAMRTDWRGSTSVMSTYGSKNSNAASMLGLIATKLMIGGVIAAMIWRINDPFFGTAILNTIICVFISITILLEFSNLILSPDDYTILAPHPVNSRTFFAAKALHLVGYVTILATAMLLIPTVTAGIRYQSVWLAVVTYLSGWSCALATALLFIVIYTAMLRIINRETMNRVLGYLQLALVALLYFLYFVGMNSVSKLAATDLNRFNHPLLNLIPPVWYASWVGLAAGDWRVDWMISAGVGLGALLALGYLGRRRLSGSYAMTLTGIVERQEAKTVRRPRSALARLIDRLLTPEDRSIKALLRAQFRNDNRYKMTILTVIPLTLLYVYLGVSEGEEIVDPFVGGAMSGSGSFLVYMAAAFVPFMVIMGTAYSSHAAAAWIFFTSPADRTRLVMSAARFAIVFFCIPYVLFLSVVLGWVFGNYFHALLHCITLMLILTVLVRFMVLITPRIPFSVMPQAGQRQLTYFIAFLVPMAAVLIPMLLLARFTYGGPIGYLAIVGGLLLVGQGLLWLLRLWIPKKLSKLEYTQH